MNEGSETLQEEMRRGFAGIHLRLDSLDDRVRIVDDRVQGLDDRVQSLDERVRYDGVLLEALRDDIRQLAEAHLLLDGRVERYRQENDAAHHEILALLRTSYRDLDRRVSRLEGPGA